MKPISELKKEWFIRAVKALNESGISKAEIARKIGVKPQYLNPIINGDRGVGDNLLDTFIEAFDINHIDLLDSPLSEGTCKICSEKDAVIKSLNNTMSSLKETIDIQRDLISELKKRNQEDAGGAKVADAG